MRSKLITGLIIAVFIICLVPITTMADEFQSLELNRDSSELQFVSISASSGSQTSAEYLLQGLAENGKTGRIVGGSLLIGTGILFISSSSSMNEFDSSEKSTLCGIGGGIAALGLLVLAIPSEPERYYSIVQTISDDNERETAAASYLLTLSSEAKFSRLITGITCAGLAVFYSNSSSDGYSTSYSDSIQFMTVSYAVEAIYSFLVKSPAEMAWDQYSTNRGFSEGRVAFQFGVNPKNGALHLGYNFAL